MDDLVELLRTSQDLQPLPDESLAALSHGLVREQLAAGQVVLREGERAKAVYLVIRGEVEVVRVRGDQQLRLNLVGPGDWFGLVAMVSEGPRSATCRAVGATEIGVLGTSTFALLFNAHADLCLAFQKALARQLARDFRNLDKQIRAELETAG